MGCASCGGGRPRIGPITKGKLMPNPIALRAAITNFTAATPISPVIPAFANAATMPVARRIIEQKRRMAALNALGK